MATLEEIKKKKMQELLAQQNGKMQEHLQMQKQVEQLEAMVKQFLSKEALERYGNLRTAHPEKAIQLVVILAQAVQSGQINDKIKDDTLKKILKQMTQEKRDIKIKRV